MKECKVKRGRGVQLFFFLFFKYFYFLSTASVSSCPTCLCTRIGKQFDYALLHLQKRPVATRSQTGRGLPNRQCSMEIKVKCTCDFFNEDSLSFKKKKTLIRGLCASRQIIADGKSRPLANVCVSFPRFFSVNICPSQRTYARTYAHTPLTSPFPPLL